MRLQNKVAVITGGSRGIGYATAEKFLKEGALVAITASSQANADKAADKLRSAFPGAQVMGICPNLADLDSVREAFTAVKEAFGSLVAEKLLRMINGERERSVNMAWTLIERDSLPRVERP